MICTHKGVTILLRDLIETYREDDHMYTQGSSCGWLGENETLSHRPNSLFSPKYLFIRVILYKYNVYLAGF